MSKNRGTIILHFMPDTLIVDEGAIWEQLKGSLINTRTGQMPKGRLPLLITFFLLLCQFYSKDLEPDYILYMPNLKYFGVDFYKENQVWITNIVT